MTDTRDEQGSAVIEFITLGMLLLLPVAYLVLILGRVQAATFAANGAAREATRSYVTAANSGEGQVRAAASAELASRIKDSDQRRESCRSCAREHCA